MQVFNSELVKVQDIDAALQFGQCFSAKKWNIFCKIYNVAVCLLLVLSPLMLLSGPPYDEDILVCIIGCSVTGTILLGLGLVMYFYINSGKKKVKMWLQDAVILKARANKADEGIACRFPAICVKTTAIQIRFTYMKKSYVKSSIQKGKIPCLYVYNKYADKDILIAYSPTYDQVMFIKPDSEKRIWKELNETNKTD